MQAKTPIGNLAWSGPSAYQWARVKCREVKDTPRVRTSGRRYADFLNEILAGLLRDSIILRCTLWCIVQRADPDKWLILLSSISCSQTENPCVGGSIPPLGTTSSLMIPLSYLTNDRRDFFSRAVLSVFCRSSKDTPVGPRLPPSRASNHGVECETIQPALLS